MLPELSYYMSNQSLWLVITSFVRVWQNWPLRIYVDSLFRQQMLEMEIFLEKKIDKINK